MKKIGIVVAVEEAALRQKFGEGYDLRDGHGTVLYQTKACLIYALRCGAGEIPAAAATQFLIDRYEVGTILNYGVVGACSEALRVGETCLVYQVVHHQYDISAVDGVLPGCYAEYPGRLMPVDDGIIKRAQEIVPDLRLAVCASGDKFMDDPAEKLRLHEEYGADICDMEAAAVLLTCDHNQVPCLIVKTVSDGVLGGAEEYWLEKDRTARACLENAARIVDGL